MKTFAFIFARGGSKGLPGKNIKKLLNKPLIAYAIELAKNAPEISRVFVSTDSQEIADIALKYGAEVPFLRPPELSSDTASEWSAWQHAVESVREKYGDFDCFVSLPVTAPCREINDVSSAIKKLKNGSDGVDVVVTASKSGHHPLFNMLKNNSKGYSEKLMSSDNISRRQDTDQAYNMTTVAYVSTPDFILNHQNLWEGRIKMQEISTLNAIDIDDEDDFKLAELIMQDRLAKK